MPIISSCPRCRQPVTIPDGVGAEAEVRCPLCAVVFPLSEAMAQLPPALIPVDTGPGLSQTLATSTDDRGFARERGGLLDSNLVTAPFHVPDSDDAPESGAVAEPVDGDPATDDSSEAEIGDWEEVDEAPHIDFGMGDASSATEQGDAPLDTSAFAGFAIAESDAPQKNASGTSRPHRKRKEKNVLKEMLGAVLGGFAGLALGYYLLNYFGGPRFDFMPIYLPGVPHTYHHRPAAGPTGAKKPDGETKTPTRQARKPVDHRPGSQAQAAPNTTTPPATDANTDVDLAEPTNPPADQPTGEPIESPVELPTEPSLESLVEPPAAPSLESLVEPPAAPSLESLVEPKIKSPIAPTSADQPQPAPPPRPADYVGPRAEISFTSDELGDALKAAHARAANLDPVVDLPQRAFEDLCRLGHVVTFAAGDPADGRLLSRKQAVTDLLKQLGDTPGRMDELARLGSVRLESDEALEGGILLAGTAGSVAEREGLYGTSLRPGGTSPSVSLLSNRPLSFAAGDQVIVLGSIINDPAKNLIGFQGTKPRVVWIGMAVKIGR